MIIEKIRNSLKQNGFQDKKVNVNNIYLLCTVHEQKAYVVVLFDCPMGSEYTDEQLWNIKRQLYHQFQEQFFSVEILYIIVTEQVNLVKGLWSQDTDHWIIDYKNLNLIIYENQKADFLGVKKVIEDTLYRSQSEASAETTGNQRDYNENAENQNDYNQRSYNQNNYNQNNYNQNNYNQSNYNQSNYNQSNYNQSDYNPGNYDHYSSPRYNSADYGPPQGRTYPPLRNYFSFLNTLMVVMNIFIFFILDSSTFVNGDYFFSKGALYWPSVVYNNEYYRVFTYMFLHSGMDHIFNNMLILFVIGNNLERIAGKWRYLAIYFGSGLVAGIASMSYNMLNNTNVVSVGASGAIFGVVGAIAYIVIINKGRMENISTIQIILFAVVSLYGGLTSQGVDNAAHIGGLLAGILLAAILYRKQKKKRLEGVNL